MKNSFSILFSREEVRHHSVPFSAFSVHLSFEKVRPPSRPSSYFFQFLSELLPTHPIPSSRQLLSLSQPTRIQLSGDCNCLGRAPVNQDGMEKPCVRQILFKSVVSSLSSDRARLPAFQTPLSIYWFSHQTIIYFHSVYAANCSRQLLFASKYYCGQRIGLKSNRFFVCLVYILSIFVVH